MELPPFRHAVAHGVATLMTAHVRYHALDDNLPATFSLLSSGSCCVKSGIMKVWC